MNANQLIEWFEGRILYLWDAEDGQYYDSAIADEIVPMLRQQQAEIDSIIEKNKPEIEKANAYIKALEDEIEALKEALQEVITRSDRNHAAWDKAKELLK